VNVKRIFDVVAGTLLALVCLPVMAIVAIALRLSSQGPVLFRQERIGLHDEPFQFYKFRTMSDVRDDRGRLLPDGARITPLGGKLRALSLDELPQLWNVLKGDMSLVGPRPLLPQYLPRYTPQQRRRHEVKPGLTGWATVNGRNRLSWEQKFALDVWYVDNRGFWLDVRILLLTVSRLRSRDGISQEGHATMPEFLGSPTGPPK